MPGFHFPFGGLDKPEIDPEDNNEVRSCLKEFLVPVRSQWRQRLQPLRGHPVLIALTLFGLRGLADPSLDFRVPYDDELPGLLIRSAGSERRATNGVLDQFERDGLSGEEANCPP